jgi:hypothetical protein
LSRSEIIERERRWARPVAIAALLVLVLFIAGVAIAAGVEPGDSDSEASQLEAFDAGYSTLFFSAVISALSLAMMAPVLIYLFKAAEARSDRVRGALLGVTIAGPVFFAVSVIVQIVAVGGVADDFLAGNTDCAPDDNDCINDLITGDSIYSVAGGLVLAGRLGLGVGLVYTCLWAMRTGLLTRFMGTLGMAVGAATVIFGPAFATIFILGLGFVILGWVPGGRPPAWEKGEAIPWPKPGEQAPPGPDPDEPVEGRADEIFPDAKPADDEPAELEAPAEAAPPEEDRPEPGSIADEVDRASRSAEDEGEGPQKRKRRG